MPKSPIDRALYGGALLFGCSIALSKSAAGISLAFLVVTVLAGALRSQEFRADLFRAGRQPVVMAMSVFALVAAAGVLYSESGADGRGIAVKFASLPAIGIPVGILLLRDRRQRADGTLAAHLLLSFLVGLAALDALAALTYLGLLGGAKYALPLAPIGLHHIWFANLNVLGLYAAAALLLSPSGVPVRVKALLRAFVPLAGLCVLLSLSRTAWLGLLVAAAVTGSCAVRNKRAIIPLAAVTPLVCLLLYEFVPLIQGRIDLVVGEFELYLEGETFSSVGGRLLLWKAAFWMFLSSPLLGVGTGDFVPAMAELIRSGEMPEFLREYNQPHNMYLFSLATNGLAGVAALLALFYRSLVFALPRVWAGGRARPLALLALATAVHFLVAGMADSVFNIQVLRYAFGFVMGICVLTDADADQDLSPAADRA